MRGVPQLKQAVSHLLNAQVQEVSVAVNGTQQVATLAASGSCCSVAHELVHGGFWALVVNCGRIKLCSGASDWRP